MGHCLIELAAWLEIFAFCQRQRQWQQEQQQQRIWKGFPKSWRYFIAEDANTVHRRVKTWHILSQQIFGVSLNCYV